MSLGEEGYSQADPTPEGRARRVFSRLGQSPATFAPSFEFVAAEFRAAVEAEREACAKLCESFAAERVASINRLTSHREADERVIWLDGKRGEAERCAKAIRARGKES